MPKLPPFVVHGTWTDPEPIDWRRGPRAHPYDINAWCEMVDRHTVIFPSREAADEHREAARQAVARVRAERNGKAAHPTDTKEGGE